MKLTIISFLTFVTMASLAQVKPPKLLPTGGLFQSQSPLKITLQYDISKLQNEKESLREQGLPGKLEVDGHSFEVSVMPRGAGSFSCQQPQLKIDFTKAKTEKTVFEGFGKLKFFTTGTCVPAETNSMQNQKILSSYLIYKLSELVFPLSFKTRLVEVSFVDTSGVIAPYSQINFILEPEKHAELRTKMKRIKKEDLQSIGVNKLAADADQERVKLMHAFQFFIGNFDYGIPGFFSHIMQGTSVIEKNIQIYQDAQGKYHPFSFDYDFSRFNYIGPVCMAARKFFIDSTMLMECGTAELMAVIKGDLGKFNYRKEVIESFPQIKKAFLQWRKTYQASFDKLSPKFSKELDLFLEAFEKVISE